MQFIDTVVLYIEQQHVRRYVDWIHFYFDTLALNLSKLNILRYMSTMLYVFNTSTTTTTTKGPAYVEC